MPALRAVAAKRSSASATTTRTTSTPCSLSIFSVVTPKWREPTSVIRIVFPPSRCADVDVDNTPPAAVIPAGRRGGGYQQPPAPGSGAGQAAFPAPSYSELFNSPGAAMVSSEAVRRKMRRRHFIGLVGGSLVAWPLLARAEPKPSEKRRVGFLTLANADTQYFLSALTDGLRELGYGENSLHLEGRSAQNTAQLLAAAAELLALKVEVLFAFQTPAAMAAREAVHDVPVVFLAADPVASGLVESLGHPGGNMTGVSAAVSELGAKNLE